MLRHLPQAHDPNVLAGSNPADDAAIYKLSNSLALVQTVDFFTPIVDDPYTFGQIAAANSLSDVYAMGGTPLTALNIVAFPLKSLPTELLSDILRGGADKASEAGVSVVGGHTIEDDEPKYGMAVTGTVHPQKFVTAHGAQIGDILVLTKPIGTGLLSTALKAGRAQHAIVDQSVRWMTQLNASASSAMLLAGAHAATDVTGFGLLGHLVDLCKASGVSARIEAGKVPFLPSALDYARETMSPAGTWTNLSAIEQSVHFSQGTGSELPALLCDPQTSGGLLISFPRDAIDAFRRALRPPSLSAVIGTITDGDPGYVDIVD